MSLRFTYPARSTLSATRICNAASRYSVARCTPFKGCQLQRGACNAQRHVSRPFLVGCDRTGEMRHDQLNAETETDTLAFRAGVMAALIELRSCVMHDFDENWRWRG
jgi:hypothetical protein